MRWLHGAVFQVSGYIRQGFRQAVDKDLAKFFDTVDHDGLMQRVARKVKDKRVLSCSASTCVPGPWLTHCFIFLGHDSSAA